MSAAVLARGRDVCSCSPKGKGCLQLFPKGEVMSAAVLAR